MKSVLVLLLNMCETLGLSELFVCLGELIKSFSVWGDRKKMLGSGLLRGISTQADTIWVFVTQKCQQKFKILQLAWTLTPNRF